MVAMATQKLTLKYIGKKTGVKIPSQSTRYPDRETKTKAETT